jgi:hypothetical protein
MIGGIFVANARIKNRAFTIACEGKPNMEFSMSQQALRSTTYTAAGGMIEESLEEIGQPLVGQIRSPIKNGRLPWTAILSQLN